MFGTRSNAYNLSHQRLLNKHYTIASIKGFEPLVNSTLELLQTRLEQEFVNGSNAGKVCRIDEWIKFCEFAVVEFANLDELMTIKLHGT